MFIHIEISDGEARLRGTAVRRMDSGSSSSYRASWHWDGQTLRAEVDRYGFRRLFYAPVGKGIAVADTIRELLQAGADPKYDDAAIAAFLRIGFFLGDDSPFQSIRAFPVGGRLNWSAAAGLSVREHKPVATIDRSLTEREALQGYVEYFRSAVVRSLPQDATTTALPLSGGRDSRHIGLELHRAGFAPGLVVCQKHFSNRANEDARVALTVAAALGWELKISDQTGDPFSAEAIKNNVLEGMAQEHSWYFRTIDQIRSRGITHVFDGIAGDVLSNGLFCRPEWQQLHDQKNWVELFRSTAFAGSSEQAISTVLAPELARRWCFDSAFARWTAEFERHAGEDDPISRFMFWNRTRRCIAPLAQSALPDVELLTPYLDPRVFDHLSSLPRAMLESRDFHDKAISMAAPAFADLPYEKKGVKGDNARRHHQLLARGMARSPSFWNAAFNRGWLLPHLLAAALRENSAVRIRDALKAATAVSGIALLGGN